MLSLPGILFINLDVDLFLWVLIIVRFGEENWTGDKWLLWYFAIKGDVLLTTDKNEWTFGVVEILDLGEFFELVPLEVALWFKIFE